MAGKSGTRKAGKESSSRRRGGRRVARLAGRGERGQDGLKMRAEKAQKKEAASKKGSCSTKLFMFFLPFAAVGAYLVLRS